LELKYFGRGIEIDVNRDGFQIVGTHDLIRIEIRIWDFDGLADNFVGLVDFEPSRSLYVKPVQTDKFHTAFADQSKGGPASFFE